MSIKLATSGLLLRDDFTSDTEANYTRSGNDNWAVSGGYLTYNTGSYNSSLRREYSNAKCFTVRQRCGAWKWTSICGIGGKGESHAAECADGYMFGNVDTSDDIRIFSVKNGAEALVVGTTAITRSLNTFYYYRIYIYNGYVHGKWGATALDGTPLSGATTLFTQGQVSFWCNGDAGAGADWDFVEARTAQTITVTELHSGYWAVISDGTTIAKAQESSGVAIVDGGAVLFPLASISIYDGDPDNGGNLIEQVTNATYTTMGGGDVYVYSCATFTVDTNIVEESFFTKIINPSNASRAESAHRSAIARDINGRIHAAFADNAALYMYYCYSDDDGNTWSEPVQVFYVRDYGSKTSNTILAPHVVCNASKVIITCTQSDARIMFASKQLTDGGSWSILHDTTYMTNYMPRMHVLANGDIYYGYCETGDAEIYTRTWATATNTLSSHTLVANKSGDHHLVSTVYDGTNTWVIGPKVNGSAYDIVVYKNGKTDLTLSTYSTSNHDSILGPDGNCWVFFWRKYPNWNQIFLSKINANNTLVSTTVLKSKFGGESIYPNSSSTYDSEGNLYLIYATEKTTLGCIKFDSSGNLVDDKIICTNALAFYNRLRPMYQPNFHYNPDVIEGTGINLVGGYYYLAYFRFEPSKIFKEVRGEEKLERKSVGLIAKDTVAADLLAQYESKSGSGWVYDYYNSLYTGVSTGITQLHYTLTDCKCITTDFKFNSTATASVGLHLGTNVASSIYEGYFFWATAVGDYFYLIRGNSGASYKAISDPTAVTLTPGTVYKGRIYQDGTTISARIGETDLNALATATDATYTAIAGGPMCEGALGSYTNIEYRKSHKVTITNLPSGYFAKISDGTTTAKAQESSGTAVVDGGAVLFPLASVQVYDADPDDGGNLVIEKTSAILTDMGGGDEYEYYSPTTVVIDIIVEESYVHEFITADALISASDVERGIKEFTTDVLIAERVNKEFSIDAIIKVNYVQFNTDSRIVEREKDNTFTVDAQIVSEGVIVRTIVPTTYAVQGNTGYFPRMAKVVRDINGRLHATFLSSNAYEIYYSYSDDDGNTWSETELIGSVKNHRVDSIAQYEITIIDASTKIAILINTSQSDLFGAMVLSKELVGGTWKSTWVGSSPSNEYAAGFAAMGYSLSNIYDVLYGGFIFGYDKSHYRGIATRNWDDSTQDFVGTGIDDANIYRNFGNDFKICQTIFSYQVFVSLMDARTNDLYLFSGYWKEIPENTYFKQYLLFNNYAIHSQYIMTQSPGVSHYSDPDTRAWIFFMLPNRGCIRLGQAYVDLEKETDAITKTYDKGIFAATSSSGIYLHGSGSNPTYEWGEVGSDYLIFRGDDDGYKYLIFNDDTKTKIAKIRPDLKFEIKTLGALSVYQAFDEQRETHWVGHLLEGAGKTTSTSGLSYYGYDLNQIFKTVVSGPTLNRTARGSICYDEFTSNTAPFYFNNLAKTVTVSNGKLICNGYARELRTELETVKCVTVKSALNNNAFAGAVITPTNFGSYGYYISASKTTGWNAYKFTSSLTVLNGPITCNAEETTFQRVYITPTGPSFRGGEENLTDYSFDSNDTTYLVEPFYGGMLFTQANDAVDTLDLRTGHTVVITNLPSGYYAKVSDGTTTAKAQEVDGTATVDAGSVLFPLDSIQIYDADPDTDGVLLSTLSSSSYPDMGGGDEYEYYAGGKIIADAYIKAFDVDETFTVDIIIAPYKTKNLTTDTIILEVKEKTFTVEGDIISWKDFPFTTDTVIAERKIHTFSADVLIASRIAKELPTLISIAERTVEEILISTGIRDTFTEHITTDSYIFDTSISEITTNGRVKDISSILFGVTAHIRDTFTSEFDVDILVAERTIQEITTNANLAERTTEEFSVDGRVKEILEESFTINGLIVERYNEEITSDSVVVERKIEEATTDVVVVNRYQLPALTAEIHVRDTFETIITTNTNLADRITKEFTADSHMFATSDYEITSDGRLKVIVNHLFTVDGIIRFDKTLSPDKTLLLEAIEWVELLGKASWEELGLDIEWQELNGKATWEELEGSAEWLELNGKAEFD